MSSADDASGMGLIEHLAELRQRLIVVLIALTASFVLTYIYSKEIYDILSAPLIEALPEGYEYMAFIGVVEPFYTYLKAALLGAVLLSSPVILYELWMFVAPGLYRNERRWFFPVVFASLILFFAGVAFAHQVVFPVGFSFLLSFIGEELKPMLSIGAYFSFATKLLIAFGAVFELPLFILVLSKIGVVTAGGLIRGWKYALIVSVVIGALLTPPDVFSQLLMAGPIMFLYGVSILVAIIFGKKSKSGGR